MNPKNQIKLIFRDLGNKFADGSFSIRREIKFHQKGENFRH